MGSESHPSSFYYDIMFKSDLLCLGLVRVIFCTFWALEWPGTSLRFSQGPFGGTYDDDKIMIIIVILKNTDFNECPKTAQL